MKIKDVMTRNPEGINPDANQIDCARKMKTLDVGVIPVLEGDRPIGVITDRDIVIRCVAEGKNLQQLKVRDCMSTDIVTCSADDDVQQAAKIMQDRKIRRLLVVDNNQRLIGILSLGDLATEVGKKEIPAKTLEKVSQPSQPKHRKVA